MKNIFLAPLSFSGPGSNPAFGPGFGPVSGPANERPYLFVILSVVIHALVLLLLTSLPKGGSVLLLSVKERPLDIEIVQLPETPSAMGEPRMPEKISAYAQRTQTVEKEEYPMRIGRSETVKIPSQAGKPSIILVKPEGEGGNGQEAVAEPKTGSLLKGAEEKALNDTDGAITLVPASSIPDIGDTRATGAPGEKGADGEVREGLSLMPSESVLHQIARQEERSGVESPRAGSGTTLLLNTSEFRFQKYFMDVKRRIEFFWDYPPLAARRGQQGRLKIDFVIQKDGTLKPKDITILKSSNYPILDDAAQTALRLASPFNPFPEGFDLKDITVHGSFEYNLYRGR